MSPSVQDLAALEEELAHLADAIAAGGDVPALLAAVRAREAKRRELLERRQHQPHPVTVDAKAIMADLHERLSDWRSLLHDHPLKARGLIKQLVVGRLEMTPNQDERYYVFRGTGTLLPVLAGVVPQSMASLTGFEPVLPP